MAIKTQDLNLDVTKHVLAASRWRTWMFFTLAGLGAVPFLKWNPNNYQDLVPLSAAFIVFTAIWLRATRFDGISHNSVAKLGAWLSQPIVDFFGGRPKFFSHSLDWGGDKNRAFFIQCLGFDGKNFCLTVGNKALFFTREDIITWNWRISGYSIAATIDVPNTIAQHIESDNIREANHKAVSNSAEGSGLFLSLKSDDFPIVQFRTTDKDTLMRWDAILTQAINEPAVFDGKTLVEPSAPGKPVSKPTGWRNAALAMVCLYILMWQMKMPAAEIPEYWLDSFIASVGEERRENLLLDENFIFSLPNYQRDRYVREAGTIDPRQIGSLASSLSTVPGLVCRPGASHKNVVVAGERVYFELFGVKTKGSNLLKYETMCLRRST
jgi:hypothetical protein